MNGVGACDSDELTGKRPRVIEIVQIGGRIKNVNDFEFYVEIVETSRGI